MSSLDWTVQAFCGREDLLGASSATRRSGIDFEGFGCQGWLDPGGRIQASPAEGTVQCGERQRVIATVHNEGVGANRGSLNMLLNDSTELDDVARALNVLDVDTQEGIIKAAVKPVVQSLMETGGLGKDQQDDEEKEEFEQHSEEEDHCPPLHETLSTSWITQIGEEGPSETEAMDSFVAMNEQRKRTWAQAQELEKAARSSRKREIE